MFVWTVGAPKALLGLAMDPRCGGATNPPREPTSRKDMFLWKAANRRNCHDMRPMRSSSARATKRGKHQDMFWRGAEQYRKILHNKLMGSLRAGSPNIPKMRPCARVKRTTEIHTRRPHGSLVRRTYKPTLKRVMFLWEVVDYQDDLNCEI